MESCLPIVELNICYPQFHHLIIDRIEKSVAWLHKPIIVIWKHLRFKIVPDLRFFGSHERKPPLLLHLVDGEQSRRLSFLNSSHGGKQSWKKKKIYLKLCSHSTVRVKINAAQTLTWRLEKEWVQRTDGELWGSKPCRVLWQNSPFETNSFRFVFCGFPLPKTQSWNNSQCPLCWKMSRRLMMSNSPFTSAKPRAENNTVLEYISVWLASSL